MSGIQSAMIQHNGYRLFLTGTYYRALTVVYFWALFTPSIIFAIDIEKCFGPFLETQSDLKLNTLL